MKTQTKIIALLLALCLLFCGCAVADQTVTADDLTITIPGNYKDYGDEDFSEGYTLVYGRNDAVVMALKEEFSIFEEYNMTLTLQEYADLVLQANNITDGVQEVNGILTFSFTNESNGESHSYQAAVFESEDAFWLIQAGCLTENFEENQETFMNILTSVKIG